MYPGMPPAGRQPVKALVQQPAPLNSVSGQPPIAPTPPASHAGGPASAYVDPYLFESGYYASRAEYNELQRTAPSRIRLRADVENARPKRRPR